jgi:hypothetical protein
MVNVLNVNTLSFFFSLNGMVFCIFDVDASTQVK